MIKSERDRVKDIHPSQPGRENNQNSRNYSVIDIEHTPCAGSSSIALLNSVPLNGRYQQLFVFGVA